ncbi:MAG: endonuclease/exonuclease/phosphatase family protein [Fidelibacterota bacterium]
MNRGIAVGLLAPLLLAGCVPKPQPLSVGFWNVENLFDLQDDPATQDEEFTPGGRKGVTRDILDLKLGNLAHVLSLMDADILGLAEVENRRMVEMLSHRYGGRDYRIIHYESPDVRGIDVALLYDPTRFRLAESRAIPVDLKEARPTRDILYARGKTSGGELHIYVNHWPSHWDGTEKTNPLRAMAARTLRSEVDRLLENDPGADIIILGDFNDQPDAPSVSTHLGCSLIRDSVSVGKASLFNLMGPFLNEPGKGTIVWEAKDLIYDQIIASPGLLDSTGLTLKPESVRIVDRPELRQKEGPFEGYPFRFWAGDSLLGGYSDHLPVMVTLGPS